jgi:hypothetical protein
VIRTLISDGGWSSESSIALSAFRIMRVGGSVFNSQRTEI